MKLRIEVLYDPERFRLGSQKNAPSSTKGVADEIANTGSQEFFGWTVSPPYRCGNPRRYAADRGDLLRHGILRFNYDVLRQTESPDPHEEGNKDR